MSRRDHGSRPVEAVKRPEAAEARRLRAAELLAQGRSQAEVAEAVGVSRESVRRWQALLAHGGWRRCGAAGPGAGRPSCRMPRPLRSSRRCARALWLTGSTATCGPWTGWPRWSSGSPGCAWPGRRLGGCWSGGWAGACSGPSARPGSVTRRQSLVGWPMSGPGSKRGVREIGLASLLRRVGHLAAAGHPSDVVAAWGDPGPAASL